MLIKQTIEKKSVNILFVILAVVAMIVLSDLVDLVLSDFSPLIRSLGSLGVLAASVFYCYQLIYFRLVEFNYRLIAGEMVFERVVGRSNHAFYSLLSEDVVELEAYDHHRIPKRDVFTNSLNKKKWQVLSFNKAGKLKQIVIEPQPEIYNRLKDLVKENAEKRPDTSTTVS